MKKIKVLVNKLKKVMLSLHQKKRENYLKNQNNLTKAKMIFKWVITNKIQAQIIHLLQKLSKLKILTTKLLTQKIQNLFFNLNKKKEKYQFHYNNKKKI